MRGLAIACAAWLSCDRRPRADTEVREMLNPMKTALPSKPVLVELEDETIEVRYKRHYDAFPQKLREAYEAVMYPDEVELMLNVSEAGLSRDHLAQVFHILRKHRKFTTVMIDGNKLCPEDMQTFCAALLQQERVEDLDLADCDLDDECAEVLAKTLPRLKNLRQLRLSRNKLGPQGVAAICNALQRSKLVSLWLSGNDIGVEGAVAIAALLATIKVEVLEIAKAGLTATQMDKLSGALKRSRKLRVLKAYNNPLGPEGLKAFAMDIPSSLEIIDLASTGMGPEGTKFLGVGLTNVAGLAELHLERNDIEDQGVILLGASQNSFSKLRHLNVSCNKLQEKSCLLLCKLIKNQFLRTFRATHSYFRESANDIPYSFHTLKHLDLRESHVYFQHNIKRKMKATYLDLSTTVAF